MSLRVLTQGGGGTGGASASIFITGLSEADTVTATKNGKTVRGKWTQKKNPLYVLPDGYTQFEYIESTGKQHINSRVIGKNGTEVTAELQLTSSANSYLFGYAGGSSNRFAVSYWSAKYGFDNPTSSSVYTSVTGTDRHTISLKDGVINIDGATTGTPLTQAYSTPHPIFVFARSIDTGAATSNASMKLFSMQIYDNGTLVRDFIPAKRNSDSVLGLYDIANNVFYTNAGSGTFAAGAEIPQYIYGHEITIKDYGMYTVTATNGEDTATQDVLVDAAIEFDIELIYSA